MAFGFVFLCQLSVLEKCTQDVNKTKCPLFRIIILLWGFLVCWGFFVVWLLVVVFWFGFLLSPAQILLGKYSP